MKKEQIEFLLKVALENKGSIGLTNTEVTLPSNDKYTVNSINDDGTIEDAIGIKKYTMKMLELPDEYIEYVYNEVFSGRYHKLENVYNKILEVIREERDSIQIINKKFESEVTKVHYLVENLSIKNFNIKISYDNVIWEDRVFTSLRDIPIDVINYINSEIQNGKFL